MHQQIPSVIKSLEPIVRNYGYVAVGGFLFLEDFGILVPGEAVLITAAFYAGLGHLNIVLVALIGFIASVAGDNVGFAIGNYGGRPLVERFGKYIFLTPARLDKAEHFFNKYGGRIVTVARFIDGLRQLNGIIAGISEMRWAKFLIYNIIGSALWVGTWSLVGYYGGSHISEFLHFEAYLSIGIAVIFIGRLIYKKYIRKPVKDN